MVVVLAVSIIGVSPHAQALTTQVPSVFSIQVGRQVSTDPAAEMSTNDDDYFTINSAGHHHQDQVTFTVTYFAVSPTADIGDHFRGKASPGCLLSAALYNWHKRRFTDLGTSFSLNTIEGDNGINFGDQTPFQTRSGKMRARWTCTNDSPFTLFADQIFLLY